MKNILAFSLCMFVSANLWAAETYSRRSMASQMIASPRAVQSDEERAAIASKNQINMMGQFNKASESKPVDTVKADNVVKVEEAKIAVAPETAKPDTGKTQKQKEKEICLSNNIGVGDTFVWASRYRNTNNYATMLEDTEEPDNNVCFVKVEIKSSDAKIKTNDLETKYFPMGANITCGSWIDEEMLRQRIMDAKKSARTWATVGGVVGGAGIGVGAMELFGNRLIGGKVEGQKAKNLDDIDVMRSKMLATKDSNIYNEFVGELKNLKSICEDKGWGSEKPELCDRYMALLEELKSKSDNK